MYSGRLDFANTQGITDTEFCQMYDKIKFLITFFFQNGIFI